MGIYSIDEEPRIVDMGYTPKDIEDKYGIPEKETIKACERLYGGYGDSVVAKFSKYGWAVWEEEDFLRMAKLKPMPKYSDPKWVTAVQLTDKFFVRENEKLSENEEKDIFLEKMVRNLREFVKRYPDSVYDNGVKKQTIKLYNFDPVRLDKKYLNKFKKEFNLTVPSDRVILTRDAIKKAVGVTDDKQIDQMIKEFDYLNHGSMVNNPKTNTLSLRKMHLHDFSKHVTNRMAQIKKGQNYPDYKSDPDLDAVDESKMDAVAWQLAAKKAFGANKADKMIFAEMAKIKNGRE